MILIGTRNAEGLADQSAPRSLLDGYAATVCSALGVRSLNHRSALLELSRRNSLPAGLVRTVFATIADNWRRAQAITGGGSSTRNWRWRSPQLEIAAHNASAEVVLERALIAATERLGFENWANQVPVASGIAGPSRERRRAIDLVHRLGPKHFELIELKVASDTPLYAAFEIIGYTSIWLLSRAQAGIGNNPLLGADKIDAIVWAPCAYYARFKLSELRAVLNRELAVLGAEHGMGLTFRFDTYPDELAVGPYSDKRIEELLHARRPL